MDFNPNEKSEACARIRNTVRSRLSSYGVEVEKPALVEGKETGEFEIVVSSDELDVKNILDFLSNMDFMYAGNKYSLKVSFLRENNTPKNNTACYMAEVVCENS